MKKNKETGGFLKAADKILRRHIYPACLIFTLAVFAASAIASAVTGRAAVPTLGFLGMLLAFSFYMTLANLIFSTRLNPVLKGTLHFAATIAGFSLVFVVFSGYYKNGNTALFIIFTASAVYAAVFAATMIIKSAASRKADDEKEYKSQF